MHFKRKNYEIEFIDGDKIKIEGADSIESAMIEAKKIRINKCLNSIVISCGEIEE